MLRRETVADAEALPAFAEDGKRLSAVETGGESALVFEGCDGLERLSPEDALPLRRARVEALLALRPQAAEGTRLVTGQAVWVAALCEGAPLRAGQRCRVRFDGSDRALEAAVQAAEEDAVLLRLTEDLTPLCRTRFVEGVIED